MELPEVEPEGSGKPVVTVPEVLETNQTAEQQTTNTVAPVSDELAFSEPQQQDEVFDLTNVGTQPTEEPVEGVFDLTGIDPNAQLKAEVNNQVQPKLVSLKPKVIASRTGGYQYQPFADGEADNYQDLTTAGVKINNPDILRQQYPALHLNGQPKFNPENLYNHGIVPTLSSFATPEEKDDFIKSLQEDLFLPFPTQEIAVPTPKKGAGSLFKSLQQVDKDIESNLNNKNKLDQLSKAYKETQSEEDLNKINDLLSKDMVANIYKKYNGQEYIYQEQIASDIQDQRNAKKYKILSDSGYASPIPSDLPPSVGNFLMSDEYLNSSVLEKKAYAKMLYKTNEELHSIKPEVFYSKVAPTFTPAVNAVILKEQAKEKYAELEKERLSSNLYDPFKKQMFLENKTSELYKNKYIERAQGIYSKLINTDFEDESGYGVGILKELYNNKEDYVSFLSAAFGIESSAKLYSVISQVKNRGTSSLNKEDKTLYDAYATFNSYEQLTKPDGITKAFAAVPSLIAFFGELGVTAGVGQIFNGLIKGGLKKAGLKLSEHSVVAEGILQNAKAINSISGNAITKLALNAAKPISFTTGVLAQTTAARSFETINESIKKLTPNPSSIVDYNTSQQIEDLLPPTEDGVPTTVLKSYLTEAATVGTGNIGHGLEKLQNGLLLRLLEKLPKGGTGQKLLSHLFIQEEAAQIKKMYDAMGKELTRPTLIKEILHRAKVPATPVEFAAWGVFLPRVEYLIDVIGENQYKDDFWSNPVETMEKEVPQAVAGLIIPSLGGRVLGMGQMLWMKKVMYHNEIRYMNFVDDISKIDSRDFLNPEIQDKLLAEAFKYKESRSKDTKLLGEWMESFIKKRNQFEQGKIEGVEPNITFAEYRDKVIKAQMQFNQLDKEIKDGTVDIEKLNEYIETAPDFDLKEEFQFHKDLIELYGKSETKDTLKDFIDKRKSEYYDIKKDFMTFDILKSNSDITSYEKRIDDLLLPEVYKKELAQTFQILKGRWLEERSKFTISTEATDAPEVVVIKGQDGESHSLLKKSDGTYSFKSNNPDKFVDNVVFEIESPETSNQMASIIQNAVKNSDIAIEQKKAVSQAVKEKLLDNFAQAELLAQLGGEKNFSQLLSWLNETASVSELTPEEKAVLTEGISRVIGNEASKDRTVETARQVKSLLITALQNGNILNAQDIIDLNTQFKRKMLKQLDASADDALIDLASQGDRDAVEELTARISNKDDARETFVKLAEKALRLSGIKIGKNFTTLKETNKSVAKFDKRIDEMLDKKLISDEGANLIRGLLTVIPTHLIDINQVSLKESPTEASAYQATSKIVHIRYNNKISQAKLVGEIFEEIKHMVHRNLANAIANGGITRGDFVMTDAEISEITKSDRADVVAKIARWYKGQDYDYNRFLYLKDKFGTRTPEEEVEWQGVKDMLLRYAAKYGQDWKSLDFKDTDNKELGWQFNTEMLVRNYNRYKQLKGAGYTSAEAHYYSAYAHEYFAGLFADFYVADITERLAGDASIPGLMDNMAGWVSHHVSIPMLQRLFMSDIYEASEAKKELWKRMSSYDIAEIKRIATEIGATASEAQKESFDSISEKLGKELLGRDNQNTFDLAFHYKDVIQSPESIDAFYAHVTDQLEKLGYDSQVANDYLNHLTKDVNIGAFREEKEQVVYVSNLAKALEKLHFTKTSSQQWLQKLLSSGANKTEIERYGLDRFFEENKNPTKTQIQEFLADKVMKVKDIVLGGEVNKVFTELNTKIEEARSIVRSNYYGMQLNVTDDGGLNIFDRSGHKLIYSDTQKNEVGEIIPFEFSIEKSLKIENPSMTDDEIERVVGIAREMQNNKRKLNEIQNDFGNNKIQLDTRWSGYTTFPLNNYRELLPVLDTEAKLFSHESHFSGIKNQLYHNRLNDVTTESGKNLLLSEEMQGDWTQKENKLSKQKIDIYENTLANINKRIELEGEDSMLHNTGVLRYESLNKNLLQEKKRLEDLIYYEKSILKQNESPYTQTSDWVRAAIKRMIKMAVDEGKDGIAWTPAHIQVDRWSSGMRNVVDEIRYEIYPDAISIKGSLGSGIETKKNKQIIVRGFKSGENKTGALTFVEVDGKWLDENGNSMQETFGTEMSKQMIEAKESGNISGENIIVGGQGYIDIYDKAAVNIANKIAKKYGLEVTQEEVKSEDKGRKVLDVETGKVKDNSKIVKVHSLIFNDKLKEDISSSNEVMIFSKREQAPEVTDAFTNPFDFVNDKIELEKERQIFTYRGDIGFANMKKSNPVGYEAMKRKREAFDNADFSDSIKNFINTGFFMESLHGKNFVKSEISDKRMKLQNIDLTSIVNSIIPGEEKMYRLSYMLKHQDLYDSYPMLRDTAVRFYRDENVDSSGSFEPNLDRYSTIHVNVDKVKTEEQLKSVLIHEIQHNIQEVEGWWKGSSPDTFKNNLELYNTYILHKSGDKFIGNLLKDKDYHFIRAAIEKINSGIDISQNEMKFIRESPKYEKFYEKLFDHVLKSEDYKYASDLYRNSIGEIEARDVERRLTPTQEFILPTTMALTIAGKYTEANPWTDFQTTREIKASETIPFVNAYRNEKVELPDVYQHQDKNAERLLEVQFKGDGGNNWKYKIENAGDILRELAKYKNEFVDPSYIFEKVNKIEKFLKEQREGVHEDDRYSTVAAANKDRIELFTKAYEEQPVLSEAQEHARKLALNIIQGKMLSAQHEIDYFNKLRGDGIKDSKQMLMEANKYATTDLNPNVSERNVRRLLGIDDVEIGSYRNNPSVNPTDVAWYHELFTDKKAEVDKRLLQRAISEIDNNISDYGKTVTEQKRNASEHARDLVDMWKNRAVQTLFPKASVYKRKEILRLLAVPFRKKLVDYNKDIAFIENVATNANYREAFIKARDEQDLARNRFMRKNKDNPNFYLAVRDLSRINLKMFETKEELDKFVDLISSKPKDINTNEFIEKAGEVQKRYLEWKTQYNDQIKELAGEDTNAEDYDPIVQEMQNVRRAIIDTAKPSIRDYGTSVTDKGYLSRFLDIDVSELEGTELDKYEEIIQEQLKTPEEVSHKLMNFVWTKEAEQFYEDALEQLSREGIEIINKKSATSNFGFIDWLSGTAPFGRLFGKDSFGNVSFHNITSVFEMAEGMTGMNEGLLRKTINRPLDVNYQRYLKAVDNAIRDISPVGEFTLAQMHKIGIKSLLEQRPSIKLSENSLKWLFEQGVDIDNIAKGEILDGNSGIPELDSAYDLLLKKNILANIKDSILLSFGIKPDETWTDQEVQAALDDTAIMSRKPVKQIKEELAEVEEAHTLSLSEIIDGMIEGTLELMPEEKAYQDKLRKALDDVKNGVHSDGVTLKDGATKYYGIPFQEIQNYFPMLRYKTYLTAKTYFDPEGEGKDTPSYGVYDELGINTAFYEERKPAIMSLNTNAYDAVRRRIDDQLFLLNNIEQQQFLKKALATPLFNGKGSLFNKESSNWIIEQLNGVYNRGVNEERGKLMKDVRGRVLYTAISNARILAIADALKGFSQLSTIAFAPAKMKGSDGKRLQDVGSGVNMAIKSYQDGTPENNFLREHAPEVYFRELSTYDFATHDSGAGQIRGVLKGLTHGVYKTNNSRFKTIKNEVLGRDLKEFATGDSEFGKKIALKAMTTGDMAAARVTFFSLYKNYCDHIGVSSDLTRPNQEAIYYAINGMRETQHTSNPIHKTGIAYGNIAGGSQSLGDWTGMNILAFKSYSLNERNTLMKARERMRRAMADGNWEAARDEARHFVYSFASKLIFQYAKLVFQKHVMAATASALLGKDDSRDQALEQATSFKNVAFHALMDYFAINEVGKWGASLSVYGAERLIRGQKLNKEQRFKYGYNTPDQIDKALTATIISGFAGSLIDDISRSADEAEADIEDHGKFFDSRNMVTASKLALQVANVMRTIPGSAEMVDLLREVERKKKIKGSGSGVQSIKSSGAVKSLKPNSGTNP